MASVGRNAGYNLLGSIAPLLLSLVTIPLYLHLVGPERYGVLAISWLLLGYFGVFDLGLGRATAYSIAAQKDADPADRAETFWTATLLNPVIGLIGGVVLLAASWFYFSGPFEVPEDLRPEIMRALPVLALALPVATLTGTLAGTLQGREKFRQLNTVSATSTALFQLLPLSIAWFHGPDLPLLLGASVGARLLGCAWLGWLAWREVAQGHAPRFSRSRLRGLLGYGGWAAVSGLIGPLLLIGDRLVIGAVFGASAVTLYSVPFQMIQRVMVVPTALNSALMPRLTSQTVEERKQLSELSSRTLEALLTPSLMVAILLAEPALKLWVGATLGVQMAPLAQVMIVGVWLFALSSIQITLNYANGQPKRVTLAYLVELPLYALVLFGAIEWLGLIGAAVAYTFRTLLDLLVQRWSSDRSWPPGRTWIGLAILVAAAAMHASHPPLLTELVGGCILLASALAFSWRTLPKEMIGFLASKMKGGS
jgi:O-antigen/teichoic acid export membrane protein